MKIALVYDRVNKWGGAERVLLALHEIWPEAPLYTAVYSPKTAPWAKVFRVIPSFLDRFPLAKRRHEIYPWLTPLAFESFNFSDYEVVVSVTSEAAKGIITKPKTFHLCYCLTPTRYLWSGYEDYFSSSAWRLVGLPTVSFLRAWDKMAAQRPDEYIAISKNVQQRIKKYYGRDSEVIYPPVEVKKFQTPSTRSQTISEYFLLVSRLVPYKRIDIAIKAFNELGLPLKIIGVGSQMRRLKKMARKNIEFLGQLTDRELLGYYQRCQAVIFPQKEDFGLVSLEVQACGRPVIAYRDGGALETVIEGKTGVFFSPQTAAALIKAIEEFKSLKGLKSEDCRKNAERFSKEKFKKKFKKIIEERWKKAR